MTNERRRSLITLRRILRERAQATSWLRDANEPPPNVELTFITGLDTLHAMIEGLNDILGK